MARPSRLFFPLGLVLAALFLSAPAHAECGGSQECVGVSIDPLAAPAHGTPFTSAPLAFGSQTTGTASATRTILVAAVLGPAGTRATLNAITLSGVNAAEFNIAATTCAVGTASLLHDGAVTAQISNACSISVTFNPATVGAKAAQIDVQTAVITRTIPLTGTGTATAIPPGATSTNLTVPFNTPATLDLTPFVSGSGLLGVRITAAPSNGVATVTGFRVTYAPSSGYVGPDAFSYESFTSAASSPAAVVTVTVTARGDPSQDRNVVGIINAQAQAARRFSRAQIANFQRRMESLHRGAGGGNSATTGATGSGLRVGVDSVRGNAGIAGDARPVTSPLERAAIEPGGLRQTGLAGTASGSPLTSVATTLLSAAATRSANLSSSTDRKDGSSGLPDGTGMWIGGNLHFGTRGQTSDSSSLRFSTDGISIGADRRFSDQLALGIGLGYARDRTDIGNDGTKSESRGSSIAVYGSYQPTTRTFVDGLIGYGVLRHDTERFVASANDFARAHREGDQLFGSLAAGYEYRRDALLLSPYGRLDFSIDRFEQATETGAGLNALTYFDQTLQTLQLSLGLRAESQHQTHFGWALPRLRLEFRHDLKDDRQATIAYADQFAGPRYAVMPVGVKRDALLLGIGSDFVLRDGLKLGVDYQLERSSGSESSQAIRLWLSKTLDGKASPLGASSSKLFENPVRVEAGYAWDDNLTRARDAADQLSDHIYSLNVSKSAIFPVTTHTRVLATGFLSGDQLYTYSGLDRFSAGGQAEFQYRISGMFGAPTFGIFGRALIDDYNSGIRSGYRYSLGITARQSLTDRIDAFGALASNVRRADSVVFDAQDYSVRFNLDYSLGRRGTPYVSGEYRRGDTVSTGRQSIDSAAIAKVFVPDDAYGNSQLFAYRYDAKTVLWTLGYNWPLGPRDAIDISWRHVRSSPAALPNYDLATTAYGLGGQPSGQSRYTANQFSIVYLMRF